MKKNIILWGSVILSTIIFLALCAASFGLIQGQETQQMAERWSDKGDAAQVSCFFSSDAEITPEIIEELEYEIDSKLQEESIVSQSENPDARLWIDTYSAMGSITVDSELGSMTVDAIGIGGDFFRFHPLKLLQGSFFDGDGLMQDYCVLDEDAAWKLFGSCDIEGQVVSIKGVSHIVTGVVERDDGYLNKAAGLDDSVIYVSYDSLNKYGTHAGINHYEVVMPNPVKNYARNTVEELLDVDDQSIEVIDNTNRFKFINQLKLFRSFGTRSMNTKAIKFPYWENVARGCEDILMLTTSLMVLFLAYPVTVVITRLMGWWKKVHKEYMNISEIKCQGSMKLFTAVKHLISIRKLGRNASGKRLS